MAKLSPTNNVLVGVSTGGQPATPNPKTVALTRIADTLAKYTPHLRDLLPPGVSPDRLVRLVRMACAANPDLLACTPTSIVLAAMRVAQLGLELGTTAHLVPFGTTAQCIVDYKGIIQLAMESGFVESVDAWVVHENDNFAVKYGTAPSIEHTPDLEEPGPIIAVYAIFSLKGGHKKFDVMTTDEVELIRNGRQGPWQSHWGEMAKKTVVRRCGKLVPQTPQMAAAWSLQDRLEGYTAKSPLLDEAEVVMEEVEAGTHLPTTTE